jgi:hypothetical protein
MEFTASLVGSALARPGEAVGRACRDLAAQSHFIADDGERAMPDGSVVEAYRFTHALYQQALSERLTPTLRRPLHARIGEQLEREYGGRGIEIAQRLAAHFELAEQREKQFMYLQFAALAAIERRAFRDVAELLWRAIEVSRLLPAQPEYGLRRIELLLAYGNTRGLLGGLADAAARSAYDVALREAQRYGDAGLRFRAQLGRCISALFRNDPEARAIGEDLVAVAADGHPELAAAAHLYRCHVAFGLSEFPLLLRHARLALEALPQAAPDIPQQVCLAARIEAQLANGRLFTGDVDAAREHWWRAATIARERATSIDRVALLSTLAATAMGARDADAVLALAEESTAVADQFGLGHLPFPLLTDTCHAWAECARGRGSLDTLAQVIDQRSSSGEEWMQSLMLVGLAELQIERQQLDAARAALRRAVAASRADASWLSEVERLQGDLAVAVRAPAAEAARHYGAAIEIAQRQGAALFESRARAALARPRTAPDPTRARRR